MSQQHKDGYSWLLTHRCTAIDLGSSSIILICCFVSSVEENINNRQMVRMKQWPMALDSAAYAQLACLGSVSSEAQVSSLLSNASHHTPPPPTCSFALEQRLITTTPEIHKYWNWEEVTVGCSASNDIAASAPDPKARSTMKEEAERLEELKGVVGMLLDAILWHDLPLQCWSLTSARPSQSWFYQHPVTGRGSWSLICHGVRLTIPYAAEDL